MIRATLVTHIIDRVHAAYERRQELRRVDKASGARLKHLPLQARVFVIAVYVGAILAVLTARQSIPSIPVFLVLLITSAAASRQKIKLPLGTSSSNLSISYTVD